MFGPEISAENAAELYRYYKKKRPNTRLAKVAFAGSKLFFRPNISFSDGDEERIRSHGDRGGIFLLSANHTRARDPFVLASAVKRRRSLESFVANTSIGAKPSLFKWGLRILMDRVGAVPAIRGKDVAKGQSRSGATGGFISTMVKDLNEGHNVALFGEETRNKNKKTAKEVQEFKSGTAKIRHDVSPDVDIMMVTAGLTYTEGNIVQRVLGWRKANAHFSVLPVEEPQQMPVEELSAELRSSVQHDVDASQAMAA
ncbi:MAG TPA: 1-acyl-sn-glycerol-3-phosphate acyltransferase [Candidatus Saccharimonadales bacterium]|nr:1-acyl-sn-glycerol-3-phosphate acyltransferase [Candidatus Saccharimonadales bacterium]